MFKSILFLILLTTANVTIAQDPSLGSLRFSILQILENKNATVGVAIQGENLTDSITINGSDKFPMQSVFKFPLALTAMHQVDSGQLSLSQTYVLNKEMIKKYDGYWSPLALDYPNGGHIDVLTIVKYTVAKSDNLGADILLELIGGPALVNQYIHSLGIKDFHIENNESTLQSDWSYQYNNWITPSAANQLLELFYTNHNVLSPENHDVLLKIMIETQTGNTSLRGNLPDDVIVAHKTGYSGKNEKGITGALNDIGIIFTYQDTHYFISVFVSNSSENDQVNHEIIAQIAELTWKYFNPESDAEEE